MAATVLNIVQVSGIAFIISFKYSKLSYLARTALTLSRGKAVPVIGFSCNSSLITKESAPLYEKLIIAVHIV